MYLNENKHRIVTEEHIFVKSDLVVSQRIALKDQVCQVCISSNGQLARMVIPRIPKQLSALQEVWFYFVRNDNFFGS